MDIVSPITIEFQTKKDKEFYKNIKQKKQIQLNKNIIKDFASLKEDIEKFIEEINQSINKLIIEEPTSDEKNSYWYNHDITLEKKVQTYENYKDIQKWNKHLQNSINRLTNKNTTNENGYAWSSYFSREIYDIPDKIKWIKTCNSFKSCTVINLPNNTEELIRKIEQFKEYIYHQNEIIEDECLKEFLINKNNIEVS